MKNKKETQKKKKVFFVCKKKKKGEKREGKSIYISFRRVVILLWESKVKESAGKLKSSSKMVNATADGDAATNNKSKYVLS